MRLALKCTLLCGLVLAFIVLAASSDRLGAAAPPTKKPARASDQLDYVFFASDRPVLIRMHVQVGDKPYFAAHDAWLDKLFAWFDKNGDGFLDATEGGRLMAVNDLNNMLRGAIGGRSGAVPFASVDTNKDGKVSKQEFRDYYHKNGVASLRFSNNNFQAASAKQINDAIYKRLEVSPTGPLTQEKLARLPDLLRTLDENEDELLSTQELSFGNQGGGVYAPAPVAFRARMVKTAPMDTGLIEIQPTTPPASLAKRMLAVYDKNKDGKLSRTEIGFDRALFDKLDADHDNLLDAGELAAFFAREPDLVFRRASASSVRSSAAPSALGCRWARKARPNAPKCSTGSAGRWRRRSARSTATPWRSAWATRASIYKSPRARRGISWAFASST